MPEERTNKRVFQVARDLKVVTPTIIEYLESCGYKVSRKQMEPVTEEMYIELLRRFDKVQFLKYQSERTSTKQAEEKADTKRLRKEELEKILAVKGPEKPKVIKIELPKYRHVVIEDAPPEVSTAPSSGETETEAVGVGTGEKVTGAAEELKTKDIDDKKPAKDGTRKSRRPAKKEKPVLTESTGVDVVKEVEEVSESPVGRETHADKTTEPEAGVAEAQEEQAVKTREPKKGVKRKVEPPKLKDQETAEAASKRAKPITSEKVETAPKKPAQRRFKRKRVVVIDETSTEVIETEVESRLRKETEKLIKQKTQIKKAGVAQVPQSRRKRRRRRKAAADKGTVETVAEKPKRRHKVDEREVAATIKQTFAKISATTRKHRHAARGVSADDKTSEAEALRVTEFLTAQELANLMEVSVKDVITSGLNMGMIISINQRLDRDTIELLASEFDVEVDFVQDLEVESFTEEVSTDKFTRRSPVVTVMGHVDHGKTTLLDFLRRTKVVAAEAGGITQHIGAYEIKYNEGTITFLDTPGHEAFTAMRARGAQVTDIVVLVVAADDRVMPQTLEAINHAKVAGVPIIIAVNKIDKPQANAEAIYKQLADNNILVEKWGGKYQSVEISAKFGQGVDGLLEEINVAAEVLDLKADSTCRARGIVIESRLDKGLGAVATVLIQSGTLRIGEPFVIGYHYGHVRSMYNEFGKNIKEAGPATPVQVVGFDGVPQAGDHLIVFETEREARDVSQKRLRQHREFSLRHIRSLKLNQVNRQMTEVDFKELPLLIKGDVHGSVEVLSDSLMKLSTSEVEVQIIHRGVGGISESDVLLAAASNAIVIGFHVHPNPQARETARKEGVEIRLYRIIHEIIDDIRKSLEGMLTPTQEEVFTGSVEVRRVFKISRIGSVAGCYVLEGKINRGHKVKLIRDDVEIWSGELGSLKRVKDDVKEVTSGFECGLTLNGYNDIREGDRIEAYELVETSRKLEDAT